MLMIVVIVIAVVGAILIYAATRPDTFRIERSTSIQAPPEKIFPFINDFRQWKVWSPLRSPDFACTRAPLPATDHRNVLQRQHC